MTKHGGLQERFMILISQIFPSQEVNISDPNIEFALTMQPFRGNFCNFVIEKRKKDNYIRLICIIRTSPKIQKTLKEMPENDRQDTMEVFDKLYHFQFKTDYQFSENYGSIHNVRHFLIQNLSNQHLVDSIFLTTILAKETVKIFIDMDKSMEPPKVDPSNSMYT